MSEPVGKATIVEAAGRGDYTISLDYGTADVAARVASIQAELSAVDTALAEQEAILSTQQAAAFALFAVLDNAISTLRIAELPEKEAARSAVAAATEAAAKASVDIDKTKVRIAAFTLSQANLQGKIAELEGLPLTETRQAWCADYTEAAVGEVATIEVNGEQPLILVAPGAEVPAATDGVMTHRMAMSPSNTYLGAALLPGWQKFRPTYRTGGILSINRPEDTCFVALDAAESSAQDLDINQESILYDVPIEYMRCNSRAFNVGDDVVVKFEAQDWEQPKVIGFKQEPRACGGGTLRYIDDGIDFPAEPTWWFAFDMERDYKLLEAARITGIQAPGPPYPGAVICEFRPVGQNDWIMCPHNNSHFYNASLNIIRQGSLFQGVPGYRAVRWGYDLQFVGVVRPVFDLFDATGEIFNLVDPPQPPNSSAEDFYYFAYYRNMVWALGGEHNSPIVARFTPRIFDLEWPDQPGVGDPRQLEVRIRTRLSSGLGVEPNVYLHVFIDRDTREIFNAAEIDVFADPVPTDVGFTGSNFWRPSLTAVELEEHTFLPDGDTFFYSGTTLVNSGV